MRRGHYLKGNKTVSTPQRLLMFDTETLAVMLSPQSEEARLQFGVTAYYARRTRGGLSDVHYEVFATSEGWLAEVEKHSTVSHPLTCCAHNLSFDMQTLGIVPLMTAHGYVLSRPVLGNLPRFFTMVKGKVRVHFLDTLNFFPISLALLGESLGLPKGTDPGPDAPRAVREAYCMRDVEILVRAMQRWYQMLIDEDLGSAGVSLPSQAFKAFRHRFMKHKILIDDDPQALALARAAYCGGRVECFAQGPYAGEFYKLDVNSLYPSVMLAHPMPTIRKGVLTKPSIGEVERRLHTQSLCALVQIDTDEPVYPYRTLERLQFPIGVFETVLSTPELQYGIAHRHVKHIRYAVVYEQQPIFKEYVDYFYKRRLTAKEEGRDADNLMNKLFLNSLYGKFGQVGHETYEVNLDDYGGIPNRTWINGHTGERGWIRQIGDKTYLEIRTGEGENSHPAIAAHVTAYGRMALWRLLKIAGLEECFYCDTDGFICTARGLERLADEIDSHTLGKLKVEGITDYIDITNPKDYAFGYDIVRKGFRKDAIEIAPNVFMQTQFRSITGAIRAGVLNQQIVRQVEKNRDTVYHKGHVLADGRTAPFRLPQDAALLGTPRAYHEKS